MPGYIEDREAYDSMVREHASSSGFTPSQLKSSTLRGELAAWAGEGISAGTLLARAWSGTHGLLLTYVDAGDRLLKIPFWRGSGPYGACVKIPYGSEVEATMRLSRTGRAYCTSIRESSR